MSKVYRIISYNGIPVRAPFINAVPNPSFGNGIGTAEESLKQMDGDLNQTTEFELSSIKNAQPEAISVIPNQVPVQDQLEPKLESTSVQEQNELKVPDPVRPPTIDTSAQVPSIQSEAMPQENLNQSAEPPLIDDRYANNVFTQMDSHIVGSDVAKPISPSMPKEQFDEVKVVPTSSNEAIVNKDDSIMMTSENITKIVFGKLQESINNREVITERQIREMLSNVMYDIKTGYYSDMQDGVKEASRIIEEAFNAKEKENAKLNKRVEELEMQSVADRRHYEGVAADMAAKVQKLDAQVPTMQSSTYQQVEREPVMAGVTQEVTPQNPLEVFNASMQDPNSGMRY